MAHIKRQIETQLKQLLIVLWLTHTTGNCNKIHDLDFNLP